LARQHLAADGSDLVRQRFDTGTTYREVGVLQIAIPMRRTSLSIVCVSALLIAAPLGLAAGADMVTKAPPSEALTTPPACSSIWDFVVASCPLSWYGITIYGIVDAGVTWQSHGTPFNGLLPAGVDYLISKNSNAALWGPANNAMSQSNIGVKGREEFAPGWALVFDLQADFNPYSLQLSNGPGSLVQNAGVPLPSQSGNGDSSHAGQFYNGLGFIGVSSPSYGTLTAFRQNTLRLDSIVAYDPLSGSNAFSPIGFSGATCGAGDTEDCRMTTSLKYRVDIGQYRAAAFWQFGGYAQNNGANGAYQFQAGGDIPNLAKGILSLDAIYSHVTDAVSLGLGGNPLGPSGNPLPPFLPEVLTATISDDTSVMLLARYTNAPIKLYGGYEWVQAAPPRNPQTAFSDIAGDAICIGCASINNTNINNTAFAAHDRILQVFWTGAKYAVTDKLDVMGGYYHYDQNNFGAGTLCNTAAKATCSGTFDAISFAADWSFSAKFDAYVGFMFSQVNSGLANGYLNRNTIDPTLGGRFRF
jgi:predicted porin